MARATKKREPVVEGFDPDLIRRTSKKARARLAKSELIMLLAFEAEDWSKQCASTAPGYLPFEEWHVSDDGKVDSLQEVSIRYGLSGPDLAKILHALGDDLEYRAIRAGFDETWRDL